MYIFQKYIGLEVKLYTLLAYIYTYINKAKMSTKYPVGVLSKNANLWMSSLLSMMHKSFIHANESSDATLHTVCKNLLKLCLEHMYAYLVC